MNDFTPVVYTILCKTVQITLVGLIVVLFQTSLLHKSLVDRILSQQVLNNSGCYATLSVCHLHCTFG